MFWKTTLFAGSIAVVFGAFSASPIVGSAQAACWPSDPVNNTTAEDATKAIEQAGYSQVRILAKGCDSAWHASAVFNGNPVFVVWNREGQVVTEGD